MPALRQVYSDTTLSRMPRGFAEAVFRDREYQKTNTKFTERNISEFAYDLGNDENESELELARFWRIMSTVSLMTRLSPNQSSLR
jgi:hypothetical protein